MAPNRTMASSFWCMRSAAAAPFCVTVREAAARTPALRLAGPADAATMSAKASSRPAENLAVRDERMDVGIVLTGSLESSTRDLAGPLTFAFYLHTLPNVLGQGPVWGCRGPPFREISIVQPLTKRQREILDYLNDFIQQHGYAPSLEEVGRRFGLSSLATVHKHLTNLQDKGFIKRAWNRSRSVELIPARIGGRALELPLLGYVAAGRPIEAITSTETITVPEALVGKRDTYVLRVKGDSMIDEQIRDGDFVIVEDRKTATNGEMVIALLAGADVTLKKFYKEQDQVRLQPANPTMAPIVVPAAEVQVQGVVIGVMRRY